MAKVKVDLTPVLKSLMLRIISLQEQATAMRLALEDAGIFTSELEASAMARSQARWRDLRQTVERIGTTEDDLLPQLLKDFEGPVQ